MVERELELGDAEWFKAVTLRAKPKVDRIFFSCHKPVTRSDEAGADQGLNIVQGISMVVARLDFCRGCDSGGAYLGKKLFGPRYAAEDNGRGRQMREN